MARKMFEGQEKLYEIPVNFIRKRPESQAVRGHFPLLNRPPRGQRASLRSFNTAPLEAREESEREQIIKAVAGSLYSGGSSRTVVRVCEPLTHQ